MRGSDAKIQLPMSAYSARQSDSQMTSEADQNDAASKTQYGWISDSTCWSRSNDLWVMSPTRFLCAKVLARHASLPKRIHNQPIPHLTLPQEITHVHSARIDNPHLLPTSQLTGMDDVAVRCAAATRKYSCRCLHTVRDSLTAR